MTAPETATLPRRALLQAALASLGGLALAGCGGLALAGCGGQELPPPRAPAEAEPAFPTSFALTDLCPAAGLTSLLVARPREIAGVTQLRPSIDAVVVRDGFARFEKATGLDLPALREAVIATYGAGEDESTLYLVRHDGDRAEIERRFRARITREEHRVEDMPGVVRVSGKLGTRSQALLLLGRDVAGFQHDGSMTRGPARVAALYAMGRLSRSPVALSQEPLHGLAARFAGAPAVALAKGPFEGELGRGVHGLLAAATAIGAAARPGAGAAVTLEVVVTGDFGAEGDRAAAELARAWDDVARSRAGHVLGLDAPAEEVRAASAGDALTLAVAIDAGRLAVGLSALTSASALEIMR